MLPAALLVLQALFVYFQASQAGSLKAVRHPDTPSYVSAAQAKTFTEAVSNYRTYGYPLFLKTLNRAGLKRRDVPIVQMVVYLAAVVLLFAALTSFTGAPWLALAATTPLIHSRVLDLAPLLQPDFLSSALVLAAVAFTLLLATRPRQPLLWLAIGLAVFAAYQVRPATVFLVAWIPFIAWLARSTLTRRPIETLRWSLLILLVTVLPYLGFATLRWVTVGHFGLVAFGGYNSSAVAACFVDREVVQSLPRQDRRLAHGILRSRTRRGWEPLTLGGDTYPCFE
jgi:hypothetical protein